MKSRLIAVYALCDRIRVLRDFLFGVLVQCPAPSLDLVTVFFVYAGAREDAEGVVNRLVEYDIRLLSEDS